MTEYVKFRDPLRQGNNGRNNTLILRYAISRLSLTTTPTKDAFITASPDRNNLESEFDAKPGLLEYLTTEPYLLQKNEANN